MTIFPIGHYYPQVLFIEPWKMKTLIHNSHSVYRCVLFRLSASTVCEEMSEERPPLSLMHPSLYM